MVEEGMSLGDENWCHAGGGHSEDECLLGSRYPWYNYLGQVTFTTFPSNHRARNMTTKLSQDSEDLHQVKRRLPYGRHVGRIKIHASDVPFGGPSSEVSDPRRDLSCSPVMVNRELDRLCFKRRRRYLEKRFYTVGLLVSSISTIIAGEHRTHRIT
ncbi:hypothetical protein KC367_g71 [Hortaea werneckii]|nr:hypothetical protein KC367_g71 [Hortaea werneckii]